jgi:phytoene synthase
MAEVVLRRCYAECARIAARHGRTYFLATRLLPAADRPAVHALYAFARTVDDIVDTTVCPPDHQAGRLDEFTAQLRDPSPRHPVIVAVRDTAARYRIDAELFDAFLRSMRMDVPGTPEYRSRYADLAQLREYMHGSAAVIGLQLLPVLGTVGPRAAAEPAAAALGEAFQLTNFIRDVAEDLGRDRIYLPADQLAAFGVDEPLLRHCAATRRTDQRVRRALAHHIALARARYRAAEPGIELLRPGARPAIRAAFTLYGEILDQVEDSDYAVFARRAAVSRARRLAVAAGAGARGGLRWGWPAPGAAPPARDGRAKPTPAYPEGCRPR